MRIDYRWFLVVGLSSWLISRNLQTNILQLGGFQLPPLAPATAWLLGAITTAGLFISVFGHELSHALMAHFEGIEIDEIVLHPFGGLARLRSEPENPAEFRIAVAEHTASFLFAILAFAGSKVAALGEYHATIVVFFFLAWGNLLLAVQLYLPGYPLDGGRVLRAILWRNSGNISQATRMAGLCGMLIAGIVILFGVHHDRAELATVSALLHGCLVNRGGLVPARHGVESCEKCPRRARGDGGQCDVSSNSH